MYYVGICENKGRIIPNDEEAIDYAITLMGLEPKDGDWNNADKSLFTEYFSLIDFMSGNWDQYDSEEDYEKREELTNISRENGDVYSYGSLLSMQKRNPQCHANCREYTVWRKENDAVRENRRAIDRVFSECAGDCARRSERARKKRRT